MMVHSMSRYLVVAGIFLVAPAAPTLAHGRSLRAAYTKAAFTYEGFTFGGKERTWRKPAWFDARRQRGFRSFSNSWDWSAHANRYSAPRSSHRYARAPYDPGAGLWSYGGAQDSFDRSHGQGFAEGFGQTSGLDGIVAEMASSNGVPLTLAQRVIKRESGGNPRAVSAGNYGLMQIRLGTPRAMGYSGSAAGLLDPTTNMTYAMRYLGGAYGGNESRAVALYARGYHVARVQPAVWRTSWTGPAGDGFR
jgi:soluble lytic murein transglycosylase-like protein